MGDGRVRRPHRILQRGVGPRLAGPNLQGKRYSPGDSGGGLAGIQQRGIVPSARGAAAGGPVPIGSPAGGVGRIMT